MTTDELNMIVRAVVQELKNSGTDITKAAVIETVENVGFLLGLNGKNMVRVSPDVLNEGENTNATAISKEVVRATNAETTLLKQIKTIAAGIDVVLDLSPSCVHKGISTTVNMRLEVRNVSPTLIKLVDANGLEIGRNTGKVLEVAPSYNLNDNMKIFAVVNVEGLEIRKEVVLSARDAIYSGFANSAEEVAVVANRRAPSTTAAMRYVSVAEIPLDEAAQRFYILVPNDIPGLNIFTMGGVQLVMTATTEIINGITYNVYRSGAKYANGATVTINAE